LQPKKFAEYYFYTEFQSHEPEFDYLKSLEIEEKVNKIKWLRKPNRSRFLLSTNGMFEVSEPWSLEPALSNSVFLRRPSKPYISLVLTLSGA
jgi:hypothetical protein